jgi:hypothetical protein
MGAHRIKKNGGGENDTLCSQYPVTHRLKIILNDAFSGFFTPINFQAGGHLDISENDFIHICTRIDSASDGMTQQGRGVAFSSRTTINCHYVCHFLVGFLLLRLILIGDYGQAHTT